MNIDRIFDPASIRKPGLSHPGPAMYFDESAGVFSLRNTPVTSDGLPTEIAVFTDGASSGHIRAGYGVYFGGGTTFGSGRSMHTFCGSVCDCCRQTSQMAEIKAVEAAVRHVRLYLSLTKDGYGPNAFSELARLVIILDSDYVFRALTEYIYKWEQNGYTNAKGSAVVNGEDLEIVHTFISELEDVYDVQVQFWRIGREFNTDADRLAKRGMQLERSNDQEYTNPIAEQEWVDK